jgi:hypothetical protein
MRLFKKLSCLLLAVLFTLSAGCAASGGDDKAANRDVQQSKKTIDQILAESKAQQSSAPEEVKDYPALDVSADVDLTTLNSNMVYSTVFSMMQSPEEYENKTVKAGGTFDVTTDPKTGKMYYFCVVADATACCAQGLEFVCEEDVNYPDDFPATGAPITVCGTYGTYEDDGKPYYGLLKATMAY